jgi:acyl dehydratase
MSGDTHLDYEKLPSAIPAYFRAVRSKPGLADGQTIPHIEAHIHGLTADPARLKSYQALCGFADSNKLPITFPHIMASPLHMAVLTQEAFPLRLLGLVHVRNLITQHRPLDAHEPIDITVLVEGHRKAHNGIEFDLVTRIQDAEGQVVWESVSTNLSRRSSPKKKSGGRKPADDSNIEFGRYASWAVPENTGRRYAVVSGDYNPIHIAALSARLFGFPRAIAHGMWSLARCAAELQEEMPKDAAVRLSVAFKQPVLLPASVLLKYGPGPDGVSFTLLSGNAEKIHLSGELARLA